MHGTYLAPAKIIEINKNLSSDNKIDNSKNYIEACSSGKDTYAKVEILGMISDVNVALLDQPKVGDYILVDIGVAVKKIDYDYFHYLQAIFREYLEEC